MLAPVWTFCRPLALALGFAAGALSCGADSESAAGNNTQGLPSLTIVENRLVLETVTFGQKVESSFELVNESQEPIPVTRIGPGNCSCTTLFLRTGSGEQAQREEMNGLPIDFVVAPGERFWIDVEFDTSRMRRPVSRKTDGFSLLQEGRQGLILEYSADVWTPFWIEPWSLDLGKVGAREKASGFFSVKEHDGKDFDLIFPEYVDGWRFVARRQVSEAGSSFTIELFAPDELPYGPFSVWLPVSCSLPDSPTIDVLVRGVAVEDLAWGPEKIVLRPDGNGEAQATAWLSVRGEMLDVNLQGVVLQGIPQDIVSAQAHTLKEGRNYSIELSLRTPPAEKLEGTLLLTTNAPDAPVARIPVTVLPLPN